MADANTTVTSETTIPTKAFYKQKRFWFSLIGLICFVGFALRSGRSWVEILNDDTLWDYLLMIFGGGATIMAYLATIRGSMGTTLTTRPDPRKDNLP